MTGSFSGGPVVKTVLQRLEVRFNPWLVIKDPTCHVAWPKKKIIRRI